MRDLNGTLKELLTPVCESIGCFLYDIEISRSGKDKILRVFIDKEGGVDIDTCEQFSRVADPILDEADPFEAPYMFEVSSPGIERVLRTDEHFVWAVGQMITIKLYKPINDTKTHIVKLTGYENKELLIETQDGISMTIARDAVASARIYYDFSQDFKKGMIKKK